MKRIVIAIGNNYPYHNKKYIELKLIEEIFVSLGKMISENEVVITYGDKYFMKENALWPVEITDAYDRIKYKYGYSKEIIAVLTRVEIDNCACLPTKGMENNGHVDTGVHRKISDDVKMKEFTVPVDIPEKSAIMALVSDGYLPLVGGAGFPVVRELQYYNEYNGRVGNYASSSLLATLIEADEFIIICADNREFEKTEMRDPELFKNITFNALMDMYKKGWFRDPPADGKAKAMLDFISKGGKKAILMSQNMDDVITLVP